MTTELTTNPSNAEPLTIFNNIDTFRDALKMAEILSQTQLIPEDFRNKPADVLVAIEYARRLNVPPTAILPHLYVIHGRPSMSTQMLIGLVNRSGLFSRISWEEGVDGSCQYTPFEGGNKTIANYYAIAKFTELSTGQEWKSQRIDVKFAIQNGWLSKKGSKWVGLPQIMVRYRSASVLIKSVCPELALGMDFTEDLLDADDTPRQRLVRTTVVTSESSNEQTTDGDNVKKSEEYIALTQAIEKAGSQEELSSIGERISKTVLSEKELRDLRSCYLARKNQLQTAEVVEVDAEVVEPPKKRGRKPKQTEAQPPEPAEQNETTEDEEALKNQSIELLQESLQLVAESNDVELLATRAVTNVNRAVERGEMLEEHAKILLNEIQKRIEYLNEAARV